MPPPKTRIGAASRVQSGVGSNVSCGGHPSPSQAAIASSDSISAWETSSAKMSSRRSI